MIQYEIDWKNGCKFIQQLKYKRYPVSEASFFVFLQGKIYAALDELDKLKSGKIVGEVRLIREGEKDYSDNVSGNGLQTLRIYRRLMQ